MWFENLNNIEKGIFRTMNGNANELIAIGRIIKAGFPCSKVDVTNAKYDAIVDLGGENNLLRVQIKGIRKKWVLSFMGGFRSGKQFKKDMIKRDYKYTKTDCDIILAIDSETSQCYIIPIDDIAKWGKSINVKHIEKHRENWDLFIKLSP